MLLSNRGLPFKKMTVAGIAGVLGLGQQVLGLGKGISSLFGGGQKEYGPTEQETGMALDMQSKLGGGGGAAMAAPIDYYALYGAKAASENNPLTAEIGRAHV